MDKSELRKELMSELWRMIKLNLMVSLREFIEGETAALWTIRSCAEKKISPSQISESLCISRARAANILRSLRRKGFVDMQIDANDRRKMLVSLTEKGDAFLEEKYDFLVRYFDLYVDELGEKDITELIRLLRKTSDCNALLKK